MKRRPCNAPENLQNFLTQRDKLRQRAKKKPKLMLEDYEANIEKLNRSNPLALKDIDTTKENISSIY